ncbi:MAG: helix-turn-helix domain-containing protein [Planctomycetaceae bacterium]|nr:helix-turn-helix domain-containing protein [Planctomycetaceae bacterium]MCE2814448.1 helix-turn-helix domain-containing protein [Planctomycetaceae bacterium]
MLGISVRTLWEYRKNGEIPVVRFGRLVRFSVDDLRKFIESKRVGMVSNAKPRE